MLIETVTASGVVLVCRKGKFASLRRLRINGWYFLILSAVLQSLLSNGIIPDSFHYATIFSTYTLVVLCLIVNLRRPSMKIILFGVMLNFIVIAMSNGYMPVSLEALTYSGYDVASIVGSRLDTFHALMTVSTPFGFLADIIPIPEPYPFPKVLSIGDFFIMAGVFLFFQDLKPSSNTCSRKSKKGTD
jgi:hypothetical protein